MLKNSRSYLVLAMSVCLQACGSSNLNQILSNTQPQNKTECDALGVVSGLNVVFPNSQMTSPQFRISINDLPVIFDSCVPQGVSPDYIQTKGAINTSASLYFSNSSLLAEYFDQNGKPKRTEMILHFSGRSSCTDMNVSTFTIQLPSITWSPVMFGRCGPYAYSGAATASP